MDNKLNLTLFFNGVDKLSPALKNIIGLGKSGKQELTALYSEQRRLNKEVAAYDKQLKSATGNTEELVAAQRALVVQQEAVSASIARQRRIMAIDGRTAKIKARGKALVSSGISTLTYGAIAAAPLVEIARAAGEVEGLTNRLRVLGLGDKAVKDLRAYADAMNIAGSSTADNLRYLVEAQGVFRESGAHSLTEQVAGAKLLAPLMAQLMTTSKALGHELSEDQERYFLRFVEQAGGVNDPHRAAALTDGLFRAIQSSGGNVDPANYQSFLARAGTAGMRLSARSMFADFEPLIAELHESAGVGLQSAYARLNGIIKSSTGAAELLRLGVWNRNAVELNSLGGVKRFIGGRNPLSAGLSDQLATSPVDFYMQLRDRYAKAGVTDVMRENMLLFGRTGGALFNLIEKQLPTILRSRQAFQRTQSLDQAYNQTKDSFFGQTGQLTAAWKNFTIVAGSKGGLLQSLTSGLTMATGALRTLTAEAQRHPRLFNFIGQAVIWLIGLQGALAIAKIAFGGLLGPVASLWGFLSKPKVIGGLVSIFARLSPVFGIARTAVLLLGQGFLRAGAMMLASPMTLPILGAVVAIGLLGYAVYRNWGAIKRAFAAGWAYLRNGWTAFETWITGMGKNIMAGLQSGINSGWQNLKLFWNGLVDHLPSSMATKLEMHSPSRLFMRMGGHIADGLAMGIDQRAHLPAAAIERMTRGLNTGFARAAPAGTRGGGTVNHFHIQQQPGEDGEAFARRVVRVMDSHHRHSRNRSYQDDF